MSVFGLLLYCNVININSITLKWICMRNSFEKLKNTRKYLNQSLKLDDINRYNI